MKKLSTVLLAAVFMMSAGMSFAASNSSNFLKDYQAKRNAAIKKQDAGNKRQKVHDVADRSERELELRNRRFVGQCRAQSERTVFRRASMAKDPAAGGIVSDGQSGDRERRFV